MNNLRFMLLKHLPHSSYLTLVVLVLIVNTRLCTGRKVFCGESSKKYYLGNERKCPSPGDPALTQISVPWGLNKRAWKTIPRGLKVDESYILDAGLGVISTTFIPQYTWLGEYEGQVLPLNGSDVNRTYSWPSTCHNKDQYYIDTRNVETSNWARWVNCPDIPQWENVEVHNCYGRIYFMAKRPILPGQELFVYYGHEKAQKLGIQVVRFYYRVLRTVMTDEEGVMDMKWTST